MTDRYINTDTCADLLLCPDKYLVPQSGLHEALHLENNEKQQSFICLVILHVCVCVYYYYYFIKYCTFNGPKINLGSGRMIKLK